MTYLGLGLAPLSFRRADQRDLSTLVRLRDDAARWMNTRGITGQWQPGELGEEHFRRSTAPALPFRVQSR